MISCKEKTNYDFLLTGTAVSRHIYRDY